MAKPFPTFPACHQCRMLLTDVRSSGYPKGRGEMRGECPKCKKTTWFDTGRGNLPPLAERGAEREAEQENLRTWLRAIADREWIAGDDATAELRVATMMARRALAGHECLAIAKATGGEQ